MSEKYIPCTACDQPESEKDCSGCNIYELSELLCTGKLDWALNEHHHIIPEKLLAPPAAAPGTKLNLDVGDIKNTLEIIEIYLPKALHDFYEADAFDNIDYLRSMIHVIDELRRVAEEAEQ